MDNRCLEREELVCFGVSHFDCKVQRRDRKTHSLTSEYIEVKVHIGDSALPLMVRHLPASMSLREIKQATAHHILREVEGMRAVIERYWKQLSREE